MIGILKFDDVNDVGGCNFEFCILIFIEGDFAKAFVVSGFFVVGRDKYGVFSF